MKRFHMTLPGYAPTPLEELAGFSESAGAADVYVKDESGRFGLNAFKGLGGSYCVARYISDVTVRDYHEMTFEGLTTPDIRKKLKDVTFVTATDGNHGRGIAWISALLGYRSMVLMPKGSAEERLENIRRLGAEACIPVCNYDDTVRMAERLAAENGWPLVQDTAWDGYEEIPSWIMQGYTTMALEAAEQLGQKRPTHIFLQAGVGAMAGAVTAFFCDYYKEAPPRIIIVEPNAADPLFRTAQADDGALRGVKGDLSTIMAGLACGEPCTIAWEILESHASAFISMPDNVAAYGMRILGNPLPGDVRIISGESGAAGFGCAALLLTDPQYAAVKDSLGLDRDSVILCISTEGDTDRENYRNIVWNGAYSVSCGQKKEMEA